MSGSAERVSAPAMESILTVSVCPSGQVDGSDDDDIGRCSVNVEPQARHRNSYRGMGTG